MNPPQYSNLPDTFWSKVRVNPDTECWEWQAYKGRGEYGRFWVAGRGLMAHRMTAADYYGEIPDGKFALHHCDNPPCLYPLHIYYGTHQDNMDDKARRGRAKPGAQNWNSKLTTEQVKEMRRLYSTGRHSHQSLADIYGISKSNTGNILIGRAWAHVK